MTFHPTARDRHVYLLLIVICAGLVGFCAWKVSQGAASQFGSWGQALGVTVFLLLICGWLNWEAYAVTIKVLDSGLEWKDGKDQGTLAWDEVRGIGYKRYPKFTKPGLVLRSSPDLKFLPFFSPALYEAIKGRCGRLPIEIERELKFKS